MTDYLIRLGHRKIAVLAAGKEDVSIGRMRLMGYLLSLIHILPVVTLWQTPWAL